MPIWVLEFLKWLGVTKDSTRPNVGALLLALAASLLAMGYKPADVSTFGAQLTGMVVALGEFVTKPDNALGVALGGVGFAMLRGRAGGELRPTEVEQLRAELAALRVRREIAAAKPEIET
jgi:hypothetical protein